MKKKEKRGEMESRSSLGYGRRVKAFFILLLSNHHDHRSNFTPLLALFLRPMFLKSTKQ